MKILKILAVIVIVLAAGYGALLLVVGYTLNQVFSGSGSDKPTLLANVDFSEGGYRLLIYDGSEGGTGLDDRIVRMIDDPEVLEAYRNEVDIVFRLSEFLPGEGRGDYYVFLYRGDEVIAGRSVPSANQIIAPRALLQKGEAMRYRTVTLPLDDFRAALASVQARTDTIVRDFTTPETTHPDYQHTFRVTFPTVAVAEGADFNPEAYARALGERTKAQIGDVPFAIMRADTRVQSTLILDDRGRAVLDAQGMSVSLAGVALHEARLTIEGTPATHAAIQTIDLASLVADDRQTDLIVSGWMDATGAQERPAKVRLGDFTEEADIGPAHERQYTIRYWEPLVP